MASRLEREIKYSPGKYYLFFDSEQDELTRKLEPDTPEYFSWLAGIHSFHFSGKNGHFTARRPTRKNIDGTPIEQPYWSAYRRANKKQFRKYLGTVDKLTIADLENAAQDLAAKADQQPKVKTQRKRPEKREILYARIKAREETIALRDQTIGELEQKITSQEQTIKELKVSIKHLEKSLKTKREGLEL